MIQVIFDGKPVETITFPVTEIGEKSVVTARLYNPSRSYLEIIAKVENEPDVTILSYPKIMLPNSNGELMLEFFPKTDRNPLEAKLVFNIVKY